MRTHTKTSTAPETCVVYCRVSSDRQAAEEKGSLDAQERAGLAKAQAEGLRVLYVVKDAESASVLDKRSQFQVVLNDAKAGKFGVLVVDRMNRCTRSEDLGEYMPGDDRAHGGGRASRVR
jgi:DNA invertase Pin-like site-specific DNA recombinase